MKKTKIGRVTVYQRPGREGFYLYWREEGRTHREFVGMNAQHAKAAAVDVQDRMDRGLAGRPPREMKIDLAGRLEKFITDNAPGKARKTVVRYNGMAANYLAFFGPRADVTVDNLRGYIRHRSEQGAKNKTINNELIFIRHVYSDNGPGSHPFRLVKNLPTSDSKDVRFLVGDEPNRLLAAAGTGINRRLWPDFRDYVALYLYTGIRLDEANALRWSDVLPSGHLRVTCRKTSKEVATRYRFVPIVPELAEILDRRRKGGESVPFREHHANSLLRAVQRAAARAGLEPGVGVHTLRHTYATNLYARGADLRAIGALLGHKKSTTTEIYARLLPQAVDAAGLKIQYAPVQEPTPAAPPADLVAFKRG